MQSVAVFWDYENCPAPSNIASGYALVNSIRAMAQTYGAIKSLRAYTAVTEQFSTAKAAVLRSELQCSGVSIVDCPHNGRKDVADKMMIVDMLAYAIDNSPSSTVILLISGDRDFAYAMSILRLRCYNLVLCAPNNAHASLLAPASTCIDWASVAVLPGSCLNSNKQSNEEPQRSINQGLVPSTPRFRGSMDYNLPLNDVGIIVNPHMRHAVKHSGSYSSDDRGNSVDFGRPGQDYTQRPPNTTIKYNPRRNSFNSTHPNFQDNLLPVIVNSAGHAPCYVPIIPDEAVEQESTSVLNNHFMETSDNAVSAMGIPLVVNASAEVGAASTPARRATPETCLSEPQPSISSSLTAQTMYQLPVTTPLVVNQLQHIGYPSIQTESADLSQSPPDTMDTASDTATPTVQEITVPAEISLSVDEEPSGLKSPLFTSSESGATGSASSTTSAYVTTASNSASASPAPAWTPIARLTPPPQFKALVRILQLHRSKGVLKPTRSQMALHLMQPVNGNPYKQAGVEKWAHYAELARKEGIIELGGREAAAWVALTPKWYDAHAT